VCGEHRQTALQLYPVAGRAFRCLACAHQHLELVVTLLAGVLEQRHVVLAVFVFDPANHEPATASNVRGTAPVPVLPGPWGHSVLPGQRSIDFLLF
jgi:hypothetical protein